MRTWIIGLGFITCTAVAEKRDLRALYETARFELGGRHLNLFVADDDQRRSRGLMHVEEGELKTDAGMLFVFPGPQPLTFWMKNTLIPLQIGFFNDACVLRGILDMQIASSVLSPQVPTYQSPEPATFALEMNAGWFTKRGIKVGAKLRLKGETKSKLLHERMDRCK